MRIRHAPIKARQLLLFPLVMTLFFDVSGGPYGLETVVASAGAGAALLLILVTPIIWSLPAILMTAELTSAIPAEGGYYVWVKEAMGPGAAFVTGWWSWVYTWVDISIYPGLFVGYVVSTLTQIPALAPYAPQTPLAKFVLGLGMMAPFTYINIRGARPTGFSSVWLGLLLLSPFAVLAFLGIVQWAHHPINIAQPVTLRGQNLQGALGSGLLVVMWNFLAWDSLSTVAGEVDNAPRTFPKALFWALPLVVCAYLLPTAVGLTKIHDPSQWSEGAWPAIAEALGGKGLGIAVGIGAILSVLGMFNATLLGGSRLPFVIAEDGLLPKFVTHVHPKYGTPWVAILISVLVAAALTLRSFTTLVDVDVFIYSAALLMEFLALVVLRYRRRSMDRPFRIPGGLPAVWIVALVPAGLVAYAFIERIQTDRWALWITVTALASGPLLYGINKLVRSARYMRQQP